MFLGQAGPGGDCHLQFGCDLLQIGIAGANDCKGSSSVDLPGYFSSTNTGKETEFSCNSFL
jgi:hypothetical protein